MIPPFTVIVPARNEAVALARTAPALRRALADLPARVIYVLNATTDDSAAVIAGVFGGAAQIIDIPTPSKTAALNAGDRGASDGPCVYLDADVTVAPDLFAALLGPLVDGSADLVAPRLAVDIARAGPGARAVGRVWADQMGRRSDAFLCCTAFSPRGRAKRGPWPDVLADDDWARGRIDLQRRRIVETCQAWITPPLTVRGWLTVRARWIRGSRQLRRLGLSDPTHKRVPPRGTIGDMALYCAVRLAAEPVALLGDWVGAPGGRDESTRRKVDA